MSVEKENMLFGAGEIYLNNVRIGNLKNVNFIYTKEIVDAYPGDGVNVVRRDITREMAVISGTLCDIDITRLPMLMGLTMSTSQLTETTTLRIVDEITFPATSATQVSLSKALVSTTNPKVWSPDYKTFYTCSQAYTITNTGTEGKLKFKTATLANDTVLVAYDYVDVSALRINVGGKTTHEEPSLKFVHTLSDGKRLQINMPKAQMTSELNIPFDTESHASVPVSFTCIGDYTKAKGTRLFKIIKEA